MRRPLSLVLAAALAATGFAVVAFPSDAEAQTRRNRDRAVVVIQPRWMSAGTQVGPHEFRASVPNADARFRSAGFGVHQNGQGFAFSDPFYLPHPRTSIAVDWPFGRKFPGER